MAETTNRPPDKNDKLLNSAVSFERRDVDVFQITAFGIGLLLSCIVVVFMMWAMFDWLFARESAKNSTSAALSMMSERPKLPPEPRLQAEPKIELKELRADEESMMHGYGWIDPAKGIVRIPIDQAIDIISKKGLPSKPSPAGLDNEGFRMIPEDSSSGRTLEKISQ